MTKIIAPAKSVAGVQRVSSAGADEIYVGVRLPGLKFMSYSGRKAACCLNDYDELAAACEIAHAHGAEINLTANMPFMADMLKPIVKNYIKHSVEAGVDALIIADMGTLLLVCDMNIDLPVYASSYFVARNIESVRFLQKLGVTRLIASPDSTLKDIKDLIERSPIEVEAFAHGEGCSNVGGNCYLLHSQRPKKYQPYDDSPSSPIASQPGEDTSLVSISDRIPCLFDYDVYPILESGELGPLEQIPIMDSFSFCSMCFVQNLIDMKVGGLKIVGRCASEDFQERTTRYYRRLVDLARAKDQEGTKKQIQDWRLQSPELTRLCLDKRCYYAPWSGKEREAFEVPYMDNMIPLASVVPVDQATYSSPANSVVDITVTSGDQP